jgi:putative endonuclease
MWLVYMIETDRKFLYTGVTNDLDRRWRQHRNGEGAKFFRSQVPKKIVHVESFRSKGRALRREAEIKRLSAEEKRRLVWNSPAVGTKINRKCRGVIESTSPG